MCIGNAVPEYEVLTVNETVVVVVGGGQERQSAVKRDLTELATAHGSSNISPQMLEQLRIMTPLRHEAPYSRSDGQFALVPYQSKEPITFYRKGGQPGIPLADHESGTAAALTGAHEVIMDDGAPYFQPESVLLAFHSLILMISGMDGLTSSSKESSSMVVRSYT
ncbi:hypothetical protein SISNIDRAFT_468353 [Sistotremastrum niveocremeum HHB9708]|uniref:Uncharacterized protein n=1 Tax=Sistotremastrum niveocremeum HHB9708 TaxID=1314777 RepID=A0A164RHL0_9AGAM|nr:hypothetical protein SISNIDRAFT_468353 [Sistotremastrum niveocremeum HHB9708]